MRKASTPDQFPMIGDDAREAGGGAPARTQNPKPPFRPTKDDTKPVLRDPISRSDPIETEQALLRLPPLNRTKS